MVWHLFGETAARDLASTWDTLALYGNGLFSLIGPELHDDEAVTSKLQDSLENVFLPE